MAPARSPIPALIRNRLGTLSLPILGYPEAACLDVSLGFHGLCPPFFSDRRYSSFAFTGKGAESARDRSPAQRQIRKLARSSKSPKSAVFTIVMNGSHSEIETGRITGDRPLTWAENMDLSAKPSPSFREGAPLRIRWARGPHSRRLRVPRLDTG